MRVADYRLYQGPRGQAVLWLPERLSFLTVDDRHMSALGSLRAGETIHDDVTHRAGLSAGMLADLIDVGVIEKRDEEKLPLTSSFIPVIDAFRVVMTEACNFRCPGCFATTALVSSGRKLLTMNDRVVERVFKGIIPYGKDTSILVQFFGGEPLIRFDAMLRGVGILKGAVEREQMLPPTYAITTNGSLVDDSAAEFFLENRFEVGISIEGKAEMHDAVRVSGTGGKTFDKAASAFDRLTGAGVDTHVLFTPYRSSQGAISDTMRYLMERFPAKRITINTAFAQDSLAWEVSEGYAEQLVECEKIGAKSSVEVDSALTPILSAIGAGEPRNSAQATVGNRVMVTVDPKGGLFRSSQRWSEAFLIGDLEQARGQPFPVRRDPACLACEARMVCGGPNEEYQTATGRVLDEAKCRFHRQALALIAGNLDNFDEPQGE